MKTGVASLFVAIFLVPIIVSADVVISEFMYDAPGSDTGQEWVELFNAGSASVDLTKWKINDGSNHILNVPPKNGGIGSITIASGAYILLADNAPNIEALYPSLVNVIDSTLSLPNTSGTISLLDDSGTTVDSLSYTKDIGAAGDGNSLQRTAVSGTTLIAAPPSPGSGPLATSGSPDTTASSNATTGDTSATSTSDSSTQSTQTTQTSAPTSSYVAPPSPDLYVDAGLDRTVIVGADVEFDARAYDKSKKLIDTPRFVWNFGDGSTAEGQSVLHHYSYPGRYALVVNIAQNKSAAFDQAIITAEPAKLALKILQDGGIEIDNLALRDLDLSDWIVRAAPELLGESFTLPEHSMILSGGSMEIARATLGFVATAEALLEYPNGSAALSAGQSTPAANTAPTPVVLPTPVTHAAATPVQKSVSAPSIEDSTVQTEEASNDSASTEIATSAAAAVAAAAPNTSKWWWIAAAGLAAVGGGLFVFSGAIAKNEWNIIEDRPE